MRRRRFIAGTLGVTAAGCTRGASNAEPDDGTGTGTGSPGSTDGSDGSGAPDSGSESGGSDTDSEPVGWAMIPDFTLNVGIPVELDLAAYANGVDDAEAITLDNPLPDGLTLAGGVIAGVPTMVTAGQQYVASAQFGGEAQSSNPFAIAVEPASALVQFERDEATPEQIALHLPLLGELPDDATATVQYREAGRELWREGHPLLRVRPEFVTGGAPTQPVPAFAGTIFDLSPGTSYEVELTINIPGARAEVLQSVLATRPLPAAAGAPTVTAAPGDDLQTIFDALTPGDVLELADGVYEVDGLSVNVEGTADAPIVIRGASRDGVVIRSAGTVLYMVVSSFLIVENLTLDGAGVDSGTDASAKGVAFWDGHPHTEVTIRHVTILGVDMGVIASGAISRVLIYECILVGNNEWTAEFIETNLTWNDDGIRIPGQGNCAFQNTLTAFGDSCAVKDGVFSAAVYFYRNRITMTGDDACEGDYATRNFGFYDNHVTNCAIALSLDPVWGGPLYYFRNIVINTTRGPFKLNSTNSGFMIYNNTIVRTVGLTNWAWVQFNNGSLRGWAYRNNVLVFAGDTGNLLAIESEGNDPVDFSNNGWFDDGSVWWTNSGGSYGSLSETRDGLPPTAPLFGDSTQRHEADIILDPEPFVDPIPLGPDHLTEVTVQFVPTLQEGTNAQGAGVAIPNVTDGFQGDAPDIGAIIAGRTPPTWGAS